MARFYGVVNGGRGDATRVGHKREGLSTVAASWAGCVRTDLYVNAHGIDCARVTLDRWRGEGTRATLYDGPINPDAAIPGAFRMVTAHVELTPNALHAGAK